MADFFEIDFMYLDTKKSGDAIPVRYKIGDVEYIHVVDGGYQSSGDSVVGHIKKYYGNPDIIDHVVATHPDGDHIGGLRTVLEEFEIGALWMLRPWRYADELIDRFSRFTNVENLASRLKEIYPNIAALEEIAEKNEIPIFEPFQGSTIGAFHVMSPSKPRYLNLIVESEKTPEAVKEEEERALAALGEAALKAAGKFIALFKAAWGEEVFSSEETSAENEMSVVQFAQLCEIKILLTADTGRAGLDEAADFAPQVGLTLPGIDRIQVPHHGSRRNVSTETLNRWLGEPLPSQPAEGEETFSALVSASKEDKDHPRNAVRRAFNHRGGRVISTEAGSKRTGHNAPSREDWVAATPLPYPADQEG